ncbi:class I SAM-dependent methyltransferase [Streptomyces sp. NPDC087850]|uniref:class I SAM-dependent methyltransferase n=1 Tax=Streptomyces sp. NPDC087850 TaxID=3365809 RepID=UPI0038129056
MTMHPGEPAVGDTPRSGEALFGTAAADYARYRPGVPDGAVRLLAATLHGLPAPVLVDLGAGTGQVPRALLAALPRMAHIDLVDVNPGMLAQAMADLEPFLGTTTASTFAGEAHTYSPQGLGRSPDLVTCCRAFHWMDRAAVLDMADRITAPHATVAVMGDGSLWTYESDWTGALRELIQTYLGPSRRAGTHETYAAPGRSYEDDLAASAFSSVTERRFPVTRNWTPAAVVGYLRSTSFARPDLFAQRHKAFETQAIQLLDAYATKGVLREDAEFTMLLARRPGTRT